MMAWVQQHTLQLSFLGCYLAMLAYHAWRGKRQSHNLEDYLVGGRGMGGVITALSFYATFVSSVTFIGHAGRSYTRGPAWWLTCVTVFTSMVLVSWFLVAPPLAAQARRYQALTIPEFLGHRYQSNGLRRLAGLVVIVASLAYMVAVFDGAARSLDGLLQIQGSWVTMAVIFVVVTGYTLSGGYHSVVATDAVQGMILFVGAMALPVAMIVRRGGLGNLLDEVHRVSPTALDWSNEMPLITMAGLALGVGLKFIVEPRQLSRFYGLSSEEELRRGRWIAPGLVFLTYLFMLPVGLLAHAFAAPEVFSTGGQIQTDRVVPYLLSAEVDVLGPVLGAFFLTALAAAAMSSLDSVLLVAASSVDHDVISPGATSSPGAMRRTRCWVLVLAAVAASLALLRLRGIVEMSSFSGSIYAACFLPALVVGLFWKRGTRSGALASLGIGLPVTIGWFYAKKLPALSALESIHEVFLGTGISLLIYWLVSLMTVPSGTDRPS